MQGWVITPPGWWGLPFEEEMPAEEIETNHNQLFKKCYYEVYKSLRVRGGV